MPRLQAQESLRRVTEITIGAGHANEYDDKGRLKKDNAGPILREWQRQAEGEGTGPSRGDEATTPEEKMMAAQRRVSAIFGGLPPAPDSDDGVSRVAIDIEGLRAD